jgi:uncharacterized protein YndB with AHSA1/START domain
MPEITTSLEMEAPAEVIWSLLADFGNIAAWWPRDGRIRIERVVVQGEGIGTIRHIKNEGVDKVVSERLDFLDPETMTWILSIVGDRPPGIIAYVAIGRLIPLGSARCRADYRCYLTTDSGLEARIEKVLRHTWAEMFEGLESCAKRGATLGSAQGPAASP